MRATGRPVRIGVALLGLAPFFALGLGVARDSLGADPPEVLLHETGEWALRWLLATLAVTPLRRLFGWSWLAPHRRTFGLLAYFYACLHFTSYLVFELGFAWGELGADILERPYITVGFSTLLLLTPLAITSTRGWIRRLGRRWRQLHRLAYAAAVGGVVHFLWSVKADLSEPLFYGAIAAALLGFRLYGNEPARASRKRESCARLPRPEQSPSDGAA